VNGLKGLLLPRVRRSCLRALLDVLVLQRGVLSLIDRVDKVGEYLVSPHLEEWLQYLVLVVKVIHFDDECVDLLDLMHQVQVLLGLDGIQNSLGLLAELWKLQIWRRGAGLCSVHHEIDHLSLTQLVV
jgi:hypothetical protein